MNEQPEIDVVVRCRNEMPYVQPTLEGLLRQRGVLPRVLFVDNGSEDGSLEVAESLGVHIVHFDPSGYVPGKVLNLGMRETSSAIVAFVNADCVPQSDEALAQLVRPLQKEDEVVATYARQLARPNAMPLVRAEYARAFGPEGPPPLRRGAFFSMAASAVRRSAWESLRFDEKLQYSEDVDWTHRATALGWRIRYVPTAEFEHSHDYDVRGQFRRRAGEGKADAAIYHLGAPNPFRDLLVPLVGAIVRDIRQGVISPTSAVVRAAQATGYYSGRRDAQG